jgi:hypothetical protein
MIWSKLYVLCLYFLWEYAMFFDNYDCVFISVVLWLLFFLCTRSYTNVVRALKRWPKSVGEKSHGYTVTFAVHFC